MLIDSTQSWRNCSGRSPWITTQKYTFALSLKMIWESFTFLLMLAAKRHASAAPKMASLATPTVRNLFSTWHAPQRAVTNLSLPNLFLFQPYMDKLSNEGVATMSRIRHLSHNAFYHRRCHCGRSGKNSFRYSPDVNQWWLKEIAFRLAEITFRSARISKNGWNCDKFSAYRGGSGNIYAHMKV